MIREDEGNFAGSLFEEMQEIDKIIVEESVVDGSNSHTAACGTWLTLICC